MAVRCKDILQLPALKKMKVVAGHDSLDRIIRWVHVVDVPHVINWVQGGELLFITGIAIKSNANALLNLVSALEAKNLAGLVINLGPYIKEIPHQVIDLANSLNFPVFELPWEVKLVEVTQSICSSIVMEQMEEKTVRHLLEDVLFSDFESADSLIDRAAFHGYDLTKPCVVAVVDIDEFAGFLKVKGIKDERRILEIKNYFMQVILSVLANHNKKALSMLRSDSVILIIPLSSNKDKGNIKPIADEMREGVSKQLPGLTVSIGIGNYYTELKELKKSLKEAELALKVVKSTSDKNRSCSYNELGISRLLFKIEDKRELNSFYQETLGELIEYDKLYDSQLVETLDAYLMDNQNLAKAAERLHIHRNTLKYRLKRIEEITGRSFDNTYVCLNFQVALVIRKFVHLSD